MASPNLAKMSVVEIEEYKLGLRKELDGIRAQMHEAELVRARKINAENLAAKLGQNVDDLSEEEIDNLLAIVNKPKPGDVVAEIGVGTLTAKGQGGDDD